MMKKILAAVAVAGLTAASFAANESIAVKYSGPSGQGDVTYWAPSTGTTNLTMTTTGMKDTTFQAGAIKTAYIANGAITAAKIDPGVVTNVLAAGMDLPAVNGFAVTNLNAAQMRVGSIASAIDGSAVTNLSAAQLKAATVLPAVDGAAVTNITAGNIAAGGTLPALTATALTALAGGNIASGNIAIARLTNAIPTAAALAVNNGAALTNLAAATAFPGYAVCVVTNKSDIGVGYTNIITFIGTVSGTLAP